MVNCDYFFLLSLNLTQDNKNHIRYLVSITYPVSQKHETKPAHMAGLKVKLGMEFKITMSR